MMKRVFSLVLALMFLLGCAAAEEEVLGNFPNRGLILDLTQADADMGLEVTTYMISDNDPPIPVLLFEYIDPQATADAYAKVDEMYATGNFAEMEAVVYEYNMERIYRLAMIYLLPAILFLGFFMVYPLVDVFVYSFEEGYNSASQTFFGVGGYNYSYILHDPYFLQAVKNTFILVIITVPISTGLALLISVALNSIRPLRNLYQTVYFLPYVTNTLAVGLVFMILFKKTAYSDGLVNLLINWFGGQSVDFIDGPYWAKMFVLCFYTVWVVMPFKILVLTSALASVNKNYYNAAKVDGTGAFRTFTKITLPMISPTMFYLIITGFIGAFKAYSDAVALFGTDLNAKEMNTIVGYVYDMLYGNSGGYPSYASAAAIILFAIVLTITCINLIVSKKYVHYS